MAVIRDEIDPLDFFAEAEKRQFIVISCCKEIENECACFIGAPKEHELRWPFHYLLGSISGAIWET
jgi:hypothetical protein